MGDLDGGSNQSVVEGSHEGLPDHVESEDVTDDYNTINDQVNNAIINTISEVTNGVHTISG